MVHKLSNNARSTITRAIASVILVTSLVSVTIGLRALRQLEVPAENIFNQILTNGTAVWGIYDRQCLGVLHTELQFAPDILFSVHGTLLVEQNSAIALSLKAKFSPYRLLDSLHGEILFDQKRWAVEEKEGGRAQVISPSADSVEIDLPQPTLLLDREGQPLVSLPKAIARRFASGPLSARRLTEETAKTECASDPSTSSAKKDLGVKRSTVQQWLGEKQA